MPVLYLCWNGDDGSRSHLDGFFSPFLIPSATSDADEHLYSFVVDMPVVAATWLEGYVHHTPTHIGQIAIADKVLCVGGIWLALGPFAMESVALAVKPHAEFIDKLDSAEKMVFDIIMSMQDGILDAFDNKRKIPYKELKDKSGYDEATFAMIIYGIKRKYCETFNIDFLEYNDDKPEGDDSDTEFLF